MPNPTTKQTSGTPALLMRMAVALAIAFAGAFASFRLMGDGFHPLASMVVAITVFLVLIVLKKSLSPYRWLATGMILAVLFTVFPILYTVYLSFTNMSSGHLLTKQQSLAYLQKETWVPDDAPWYTWQAYTDDKGSWALLLTDEGGATFLARPDQEPAPLAIDGEDPPRLEGLRLLDAVEVITNIQTLSDLRFGKAPRLIAVQDTGSAAVVLSRYQHDATRDTITDLSTGTTYTAKDGSWLSATGELLSPGFIDFTGVDNYSRFLGNDGYRRPLVEIIIWNIAFSLLSVLFSFGIGMAIAILFENLPGKRLIRSLLIVPYPIPVLVSIMVWRGLLNENMGLVTMLIQTFTGEAPRFFTDVGLGRFAVILINVYLSYPYFYILSSGALKSIPGDLYEAAEIDGATPYQSLRHITMPMVLRILMPLLIASFCFNFNNFTIIWGFNAGLPAMADTIVPMGHTDLLVSFIYRLGFNTAGAADYGFSAAITVILFIFVSLMVFFQTFNTKAIKEAK